jgi:hypothetical protein
MQYNSIYFNFYYCYYFNFFNFFKKADAGVKEARMSNGLVRGHAYTVTKVHAFDLNGREARLIRIRNPWGMFQDLFSKLIEVKI